MADPTTPPDFKPTILMTPDQWNRMDKATSEKLNAWKEQMDARARKAEQAYWRRVGKAMLDATMAHLKSDT